MDINNVGLQNAIQLVRKNRSKEPLFFEALHQAKLLCPVRVDTCNLSVRLAVLSNTRKVCQIEYTHF